MKRLRATILLAFFLLQPSFQSIHAQWVQTNGPQGGYVNCLTLSSGNLFAGTNGAGIFLSTDNGTTWKPVNTGLTNLYVRCIAVSGGNIFAGTSTALFLSSNAGASWTAMNSGLPAAGVRSLMATSTSVYAGTDTNGVYLSTNNGNSWIAVNTGLMNKTVWSLATSGTNVYAGTNDGLFLSTNAGAIWTDASSGLTNRVIRCLAVSGTSIYAGVDSNGVFISTDGGSNWSVSSRGWRIGSVRSLTVSGPKIFAGTYGSGVLLSTNSGVDWSISQSDFSSFIVNGIVVNGSSVIAGTYSGGGIYISTNNGQSWTVRSSGMVNTYIYSLAANGTDLFAGTWIDVYRSTNSGVDWTPLNSGSSNCYSIAANGLMLFVGTHYGGSDGAVFVSTDRGTTWGSASPRMSDAPVRTLAISGSNLFAGTAGSGVFLSTNNGSTWTAVNNGLSNLSIWYIASSGTTLFAGTDGGGVFISTNNGGSWSAMNTGLSNTSVRALTFSGTKLFAGTASGVFVSTDNGAHWSQPGSLNTMILGLVASGTNLFVCTNGGVYLSSDDGANWGTVNTGLTNVNIISVAIQGASLFAGTPSGGVWRRPLSDMISVPSSQATLTAITPLSVGKGNDFTVEIKVGDSTRTSNIFGASFDLLYSNTSYIDFVSADVSGSFLGSDLLYILTPDDAIGKVSVGISRKAPLPGVSGGGTLLRLKFHVSPTAPDNGTVTFSFANVSASDQNGNSITLTPISGTTTVQGFTVWPGDADNSGVVNQADILPLGLYWGSRGPARSNASQQWIAQAATAWVSQAAIYADANGDGVINQADVIPIGLNWAKTHSLGKIGSSVHGGPNANAAIALGTPLLRAIGPASVNGKSNFEVNIVLGDTTNSVSNLFGLSFVLDFAGSKNFMQVVEATQGTMLGSDVIFFPQIDNNNGNVAFGITRKAGQGGVTGSGQIAKIKFAILNQTSIVTFTTRDIQANDATGNPIAILPSSSSTLVGVEQAPSIPTEFSLQQNYPNPFNPSTAIAYALPTRSFVRLSVINALGQILVDLVNGEQSAGWNQVVWNANASSGLYLYRLEAVSLSDPSKRFVETRKMLLLK